MTTFGILPCELYNEIFHHADYVTLKRCQRVSKTFAAILESPKYDTALFRWEADTTSKKEPDSVLGNRIELHPAIQEAYFIYHQGGFDPFLMGQSIEGLGLNGPIGDEPATMPPCSRIQVLHNKDYKIIAEPVGSVLVHKHHSQRGVTVREFLVTMAAEIEVLHKPGLRMQCLTDPEFQDTTSGKVKVFSYEVGRVAWKDMGYWEYLARPERRSKSKPDMLVGRYLVSLPALP